MATCLQKLDATGAQAGTKGAAVKIAISACVMIALLLVGVSLGRASDRDEAVITVQVTSADHELDEGYFALGEQATVMAKPGSDLFKFLGRHRDRQVRIVLTQAEVRQLSRLKR
jgi:hypothetical protein